MPKQRLERYRREVESFLEECLEAGRMPETLHQAMRYSLLAGGKRVRPVLCVVWAELLGEQRHRVLPFAAGLECIHTYSLVHDDLPAMDDDDLRRGKPSNHKQFGEALAILAGDALLTHAFQLMLYAELPAQRLVQATGLVAEAAGASG
ncbi:MAG: polyprenyl synthetase family protein, partial [Desulfohalobium sp.]